MVDVSGSMRAHGYATARSWGKELPELTAKLFATGGEFFSDASQKVTLLPFSDPDTDAREGRVALAPLPLGGLGQSWAELKPPGGGATDMNRALDLAEPSLNASGGQPSLVWLITDNENNLGENSSDDKFYQRLRDSPAFSHVVLFPLTRAADAHSQVGDPAAASTSDATGGALVMYLLVPPDTLDTEAVNRLTREVEKRTGFGGLLFRPLYSGGGESSLDFARELSYDGPGRHRVEQEAGQTVLYLQEGERLTGQLKFRVKSHLQGWKLHGASLNDAEVRLSVPAAYKHGGDTPLRWPVTPRTLDVGSESESVTLFSLGLAGPGGAPLELERRSFWADPFASRLPDIEGDVQMRATLHLDRGELEPQVSPTMQERLARVPRLPDIQRYMLRQGEGTTAERNIEFGRKLVVRVATDPTPGYLLLGALALLGLMLLLFLGALLLWRHRLTLEGGGQEEDVRLGALWGSYLVCDGAGQPYARLISRFGSLTLRAEPDTLLEGHRQVLPVRWQGSEFRFEAGPEGKPATTFWLRRDGQAGRSTGAAGASDSPL